EASSALISLNIDVQFDKYFFCDIDKGGYPEAFTQAIPRLKKGGIMITDNTLWSGRVTEKNPNRESTKGVKKFNTMAFTDPRVHSMIIPIRDGVCITLKL
ncbi:MAG: O-methyltransferase, partial [Candidatus Thorarchaeota archaeon]